MKFLKNILFVILLLLMTTSISFAAFNLSDLKNTIQKGPGKWGDFLSSGAKGDGFYLTIYEDVSSNPNKKVEEKVKEKYGIDIRLEFSPKAKASFGQHAFMEFFTSKGLSGAPYTATVKGNLQSDCIRIRTAQAEERLHRFRLVKKRLQDMDVKDKEVTLRLSKDIDNVMKKETEETLKNMPDFQGDSSQEALLACYSELRNYFDFELRLSSLLAPLFRHMESMQTFVNGRLDDFDKSVLFTDVTFGSSFPSFDLITDLDILDTLLFGLPVQIGRGSQGSGVPDTSNSQDFTYYPNIEAQSVPLSQFLQAFPPVAGSSRFEVTTPGIGSASSQTGNAITSPGTAAFRNTVESSEAKAGILSKGFGSSSKDYAGPFCPAREGRGLDLDFALLNNPPKFASTASSKVTAETISDQERSEESRISTVTGGAGSGTVTPGSTGSIVSTSETGPSGTRDGEAVDNVDLAAQSESLSKPGSYAFNKNRKAFCEKGSGIDFGNEFLKLFFCIDVEFSKIGKTWESSPDEDCLYCYLTKINRVFEEEVFNRSIRPHKNTGTIMESGLCKNAFSAKSINLNFFLEWVPIKFYPDICYPEAGLTKTETAELTGYPEIYAKLRKPGGTFECKRDFPEEKAKKRCEKAFGENIMTYENIQNSYRDAFDKEPLQNLDDLNKEDNYWAKLAGDHGIAEANLHRFLYRLGKDKPWFGEEEVLTANSLKQDFKEALDSIKKDMKEIREGTDEVKKLQQFLCLKGYFFGEQAERGKKALPCKNFKFQHTVKETAEKINMERDRVMKLLSTWNQQSADWNGENACGTFAGSGPIGALGGFLTDITAPEYYLDTEYRRTLEQEDLVTGQIVANINLEDLETIFSEIDKGVNQLAGIKEGKKDQANLSRDQEKAIGNFKAVFQELQSFEVNMKAFTNAMAALEEGENFTSQSGEKVSFLKSLQEKLKK